MTAGVPGAATAATWCVPVAGPKVVTVVGGSSPFTLALAQALAADPPWPEGLLRLQGRDAQALEAVSACAAHLLAPGGWRVEAEVDLHRSLEGSDVVVHQNRYGGLAWRTQDEVLATGLGLAPDETLGPGGLAAGLRTGHGQRPYAAALTATDPRVPVLTMTNPLGVSTALFSAAGVDVLGVCELPEMTRLDVAAAAGVAPSDLGASYTGLNHRGFWHGLRAAGTPLLDRVAHRLATGEADLHGVDAAVVQRLRAVPDKYHALITVGSFLTPGRAAALDALRTRIRVEATAAPDVVPPALAGRDMPWYRVVVVPVLAALAGRPVRTVVTATDADGVAAERFVDLVGATVTPVPGDPPPPPVARWFARFRAHEAAVVAACAEPSYDAVRAALALDPVVPTDVVDRAAQATWTDFERWRDAEG